MTTVNITVNNDADFYCLFRYQTAAGVGIDITGAGMVMMLRRRAKDEAAQLRLGTDTGEIVFTNAAAGEFTIYIPQDTLEHLGLGDYEHSNVMMRDNAKTNIWTGTFTNNPGAARGVELAEAPEVRAIVNRPPVEWLCVAGGAAGGYNRGGGGGAGGVRTGIIDTPAKSYAITVGLGGVAAPTSGPGSDGKPSEIAGIVVCHGGGSGGQFESLGRDGGSGGGAGGSNTTGGQQGGAPAYGEGQYGGGSLPGIPFPPGGGGGVGGGGIGGGSVVAYQSGDGGPGFASSISGTSRFYGAGGGGAATAEGALGGAGGNGIGGTGKTGVGDAGLPGTGSGGGGGGNAPSASLGGNGGSGQVIMRYAGVRRATGGTITTAAGYTIHTFTAAGTFEFDV